MNPHGNSVADRHQRPVFAYAFTAVLVMAAMLLGMHSMIGEHSVGSGAAESTAHSDTVPGAADFGTDVAVTATAPMLPVVVHAEIGLFGSADGMLDCAVWAMTCALVLVLAALIILASSPATYRRLLEAGGRVISRFQGPALHLFRPSLVVLSISRT
ncbi:MULTISPECIES: hypothetical protein [Cryobacterium]|uniref:hypothetical protein n=1 Tax=Cryobacterium TaxID=69578 RepID=UPI000CD3FEC9|nr:MULTISPECIES: hypothetical protein [Cryobacterium]POH64581.1 hypothetical protein C3B60_14220 [Cryobacterium zongtaii]TFC46292.1 hypothetical protein E3O57_07120 [Cryobacterium sp. TMN-39-2]